jgi:hypothetical protein
VIAKAQDTLLLALSVAVQSTLLVPIGKSDPLGGTQTTVTFCELSVAVTV